MGDGANDAVEASLQFEEERLDYLNGEMDDDVAYDLGIIDELGFLIPSGHKKSKVKVCRCCGQSGLHWGLKDGKWRLFDDHGMHKCKTNPLKEK